jgi:hypothetical protein
MPSTGELLAELRANPGEFLRHYWVTVLGGAAAKTGRPSGEATFFCHYDEWTRIPGFTTGRSGRKGKKKNRHLVNFSKVEQPPKTDLSDSEFNAWYIAMAVLGAKEKTTHFMLPGNDGPDLMLTSQLSGCTFGIGSGTNTGGYLVSHIQPTGGSTDDDVRNDLHETMVSRLGNVEALFERENRPGEHDYGEQHTRATILGVRHNTNWQFWAQLYGDTIVGEEIYKVVRLL